MKLNNPIELKTICATLLLLFTVSTSNPLYPGSFFEYYVFNKVELSEGDTLTELSPKEDIGVSKESLEIKSYDGDNSLVFIDKFKPKNRPSIIFQSSIIGTPLVSGNIIYFLLNHDSVIALDSVNKSVIWSFKHNQVKDRYHLSNGGITFDESNDRIIFHSGGESIFCIDKKDGKLVWVKNLKGFLRGNPIVFADKVIVALNDNKTYFLNSSSGETIFVDHTFHLESKLLNSPVITVGKLHGKHVCASVYSNNYISVIDLESFTTVSSFYFDSYNIYDAEDSMMSNIAVPPVIIDEKLLLVSNSATFLIDLVGGNKIWSIGVGANIFPVYIDDRFMFISSYENRSIYCIDIIDGKMLWSSYIGQMVNNIAVVKNIIVVAKKKLGLELIDAKSGSKIDSNIDLQKYQKLKLLSNNDTLYLFSNSLSQILVAK